MPVQIPQILLQRPINAVKNTFQWLSDCFAAIRNALFGLSAPDVVESDTVAPSTEPQAKEHPVRLVRNQAKDWLSERAPAAKRSYDRCRVLSSKVTLMTTHPECMSVEDWYFTWSDKLTPILTQLMDARRHERQLMRTLKGKLGKLATVSDLSRLLKEDQAAVQECDLALLALEEHFLELPIVSRLVVHHYWEQQLLQ